MKKTVYVILAVMMFLSGCGNKPDESQITEPDSVVTDVTVQQETEETTTEKPTERIRDIESSDDFEYEVIESEVVITKYKGTSTDVTVPAFIDDIPVTKIGFYAFEAQFTVQSVTLPDSIKSICEGAFMDCASMRSINLPETLTTIERSAFAACTSLESLVIPSAVTSVEMEAFTACESMFSLTVNNPELQYSDWGLEELPNLTVYASAESYIYNWAYENGIPVCAL